MHCRDCPYIRDDFLSRTKGITDYYDLIEYEQSCWCDKVGGKVWWFGQCGDSDNYYEEKQINNSKKKKKNRRDRDVAYKRKLKKYYKELSHRYHCPVWLVNEKYVKDEGYVKLSKPYLERLYWGQNRKRYYKKQANRFVRKYKGELSGKSNNYRKLYEYRWSID